MATISPYRFGFQAPSEYDPANIALHTDYLAMQIDRDIDFPGFTSWSDFLAGTVSGEVGTPAIFRYQNAAITGFIPSNEKAMTWDTTVYDNTGTTVGGELVLPDQDQRYWWWMGVNLLLPPITLTTGRYTGRLYVQDRDPATGQLLTGLFRYNQYMSTVAVNQFMIFDGFFRSGGGRARVTLSHSNGASISVLGGSAVWAVRICPDR